MNKLSDQFQFDDENDVVTVCGIRYSGELFRKFGFDMEPNKSFRILKREDGVITISVMSDDQPPNAVLAERERCANAVPLDWLHIVGRPPYDYRHIEQIIQTTLAAIRKGETP